MSAVQISVSVTICSTEINSDGFIKPEKLQQRELSDTLVSQYQQIWQVGA